MSKRKRDRESGAQLEERALKKAKMEKKGISSTKQKRQGKKRKKKKKKKKKKSRTVRIFTVKLDTYYIGRGMREDDTNDIFVIGTYRDYESAQAVFQKEKEELVDQDFESVNQDDDDAYDASTGRNGVHLEIHTTKVKMTGSSGSNKDTFYRVTRNDYFMGRKGVGEINDLSEIGTYGTKERAVEALKEEKERIETDYELDYPVEEDSEEFFNATLTHVYRSGITLEIEPV